MKTFIILLRGVMPTGKNRVPMAELRDVLSDARFENVRTYIASGNVLVDTTLKPKEIEVTVRDLILKHIGPDLVVVVRTAHDLQTLLDENPFPKKYDGKRIFYVSFAKKPPKKLVTQLEQEAFGEEKIAFGKHGAYMYIPGSAARSKLSNNFLEKKLDVSATTRNFNTLTKLIAMSNE